MPLHLLGKKSWNVYSKDNIERVRRDEAAATAREEEVERRMQQYDADRRIAILRGEASPTRPQSSDIQTPHQRNQNDVPRHSDRRKRRRLAGEDDTDRDIRIARQEAEAANGARENLTKASSKIIDAPLHDDKGHMNLFPIDARATRRVEKNAEVEAEKKRKDDEHADQYTMRFSNAAGRQGLNKPWYTEQNPQPAAIKGYVRGTSPAESNHVWGRSDVRRAERAQVRSVSNDPLAVMKKAQTQLKQSEADRRRWKDERDRGAWNPESTHDAQVRRRKRPRDIDELDKFSLGATVQDQNDRNERPRHIRSRQPQSWREMGQESPKPYHRRHRSPR